MLFVPTIVSIFSLIFSYFLKKQIGKNQESKKLSAGFLIAGLALFFVSSFYFIFRSVWALVALSFVIGTVTFLIRQKEKIKNLTDETIVIFQSFIIALTAVIFLSNLVFSGKPSLISFPLFLISLSLLSFALVAFFVKLIKMPTPAIFLTIFSVLFLAGSFLFVFRFSQELATNWLQIISFIFAGLVIGFGALVNNFLKKASFAWLIFLIAFAALTSFWLGGFFEFSLILLGALALAGPVVALSFYNNGVSLNIKGYSLVLSGLTILSLLFVYIKIIPDFEFSLWSLKTLIGVFLGIGMSFYLIFEKTFLGEKTILEKTGFSLFFLVFLSLVFGFEIPVGLIFGVAIGSIFLISLSNKENSITPILAVNMLAVLALLVSKFLL